MSNFDLCIRNARIVDGSGTPAYEGDIAIKDGFIAAVGKFDGSGAEEVDADGALVTPGFVDLHTHFDGQASWDSTLSPSCYHGVTTAVMGNCGVGFAPAHEADRMKLVSLMEGVEDIPGAALVEGIQWQWESFPEYIDALASREFAMDVAVHATHDPLRLYVMRDRAMANEMASEEDIAEMSRLLKEALEAGAIGFSTGRTDNHRTSAGLPTPASEASEAELRALGKAMKDANRGVLQLVSDFDCADGPQHFDREFDLLEMMVEESGRPASLSLLQRDHAPDQWRHIIERVEKCVGNGMTFKMQVAARPIGVLLGLEATFHPFMGYPSYKSISHLSLAERVQRMKDPDFKAQLLTEKSEPVAGDGSPIPPLADMLLANIDMIAGRMFTMDDALNYEPELKNSIAARCMATGDNALSVIYDVLLEDEGKSLIYFPLYNYSKGNLDDLRDMLTHPQALAGLSDAGAHVGTVCDASFPTFMLTHWTRDRDGEKLELEKVISMLTRRNAEYIGFLDRGLLAPGYRADINVIDMEKLGITKPELIHDLPAGGGRLMQRAFGYKYTIKNGNIILRDDELTGAMPGRLLREGTKPLASA